MLRLLCTIWLFCCGVAWGHLPQANLTRYLGLTTNSVAAAYDSIGQLTRWSAREPTGALRHNKQLGFKYDPGHNLSHRTNGALVQTFVNDPLNQLTNITRTGTLTVSGATPAPATNVTVNGLAADRYGDFTFARTNVTLWGSQNTFTSVAHNAYGLKVTNVVSVNLSAAVTLKFDSNGNLTNDGTRSFFYDAQNQLTNVAVAGQWKSEFVFDGLGRRRITREYGWQDGGWVQTNEVRYVYDQMLALQERDATNGVQVTYTRGLDLSGSFQGAGGIGGLLARTDAQGSTFYHADGAGNVTALMDAQEGIAARYLYSPFGRLTGQWGPMSAANRYRFSSKDVHAASGLSYYGFRFYDAGLQRWLNPDPLGEAGGINLFGFVGNSPLNHIDPFGLDFSLWSGGGSAYNNWTGNGASSAINATVTGPSLGQTTSQVGSSWLDNLFNTLLSIIGMTMHDPTGDPRTQQQLNAMARNAQQQVGSPMAQHGFYQPGSQEDVVGTALFVLTPAPFMKGKPCKTATELSVDDKLARYLLNQAHPKGGPKAKWFEEALGFNLGNADGLAKQLVFDPANAVQTEVTQYGTKFNQTINVTGPNGRTIPVTAAWIQGNDGVVRLVTAVPGN